MFGCFCLMIAGDLVPVHIRHLDVAQDQRRLVSLHDFQSFHAACSFQDFEPGSEQRAGLRVSDGLLIIDIEDQPIGVGQDAIHDALRFCRASDSVTLSKSLDSTALDKMA